MSGESLGSGWSINAASLQIRDPSSERRGELTASKSDGRGVLSFIHPRVGIEVTKFTRENNEGRGENPLIERCM